MAHKYDVVIIGSGVAGALCAWKLSQLGNYSILQRVKLASKIGAQGQTLFKPEDLVFSEDPSTLFGADGKKVGGF
jgi:aspartate oxidase